MSFLDDLARYRGKPSVGWQPMGWIELFGGKTVPFEIWEPDPNTYHDAYYYNSRLNILYQKVKTEKTSCNAGVEYVWKRISERR